MKKTLLTGLCMTLCALTLAPAARADEAKGVVADAGVGTVQLIEKGTNQTYNFSMSKTAYDPATWRPTKGDEVTIVFTVNTNRKGKTVNAVDKVTLVKAGPDTVVSVANPVTVEITEVGRSGIRAKLPTGQILRFATQRNTQYEPAGYKPAVGDSVTITHVMGATPLFGAYGVTYAAVKMEKTGKPAPAK
jgi:plastocyanin